VEHVIAQPVEHAHVDPADRRADQGQQREQGQVGEAVEGKIGHDEDGLGRDEQGERRIGHDRAGQARQERVGLHRGGRVQDFTSEDGPAQGRAEDRPDAPRRAGQHEQAALAGREAERAAQERAEPGPDLRDRPLLPGGSPVPIVRIDAIPLIRGMRPRIAPAPRWNARIMASVP